MTPKKILGWGAVALIVLFISSGDTFKFLPKPAREASKTSRQFVVSLWPKWLKPKDTNEEREKEIQKLDQPGQGTK
ncbi:hypothetical protein [Planktothrix agardhii]|uniref:hypothetical protein n=1 Tax=Planktothrix agardhii TaxID=1160 RepID=UPI000416981B|nr:hypothetical protein [Planktothrix agardhii]CAD5977374.1 Ketol-acid reductoisomerase [Planktothrix agardhii]